MYSFFRAKLGAGWGFAAHLGHARYDHGEHHETSSAGADHACLGVGVGLGLGLGLGLVLGFGLGLGLGLADYACHDTLALALPLPLRRTCHVHLGRLARDLLGTGLGSS